MSLFNSHVPQVGDVHIVTFPKSGTTWLQYVIWLLLNYPNELKRDIADEIPYIEAQPVTSEENIPLNIPQSSTSNHPPFRTFKSHLPLSYFDVFGRGRETKSKFIYVMRDPIDVTVSFYRFCKEFPGFFADLSVDDAADLFCRDALFYGSYFDHICEGWTAYHDERNKENEMVLLLKYEDMVTDFPSQLHRICTFLNIPLSSNSHIDITSRCHKEAMYTIRDLLHGAEYTERLVGTKVSSTCGVVFKDTHHIKLSEEKRKKIEEMFLLRCGSILGVTKYSDIVVDI
jgi:hypothetical protein